MEDNRVKAAEIERQQFAKMAAFIRKTEGRKD
jgi:hypothetical protein